jgi:hypothetical protein
MDYRVLSLESIDGEDMRNALTSANLGARVNCMDSWILPALGNVSVSGGNTTFTNLATVNPQFASNDNLVLIAGDTSSKPDGSPHITNITGGSGTAVFTGLTVNREFAYIGFYFTAYLVPNRFEIQLRDGTAQMRKWRVTRASFRLFRSYYGYVWRKITDGDFTNYSRIVDETDEFPIAPDEATQDYPDHTGQTFPQALNFDWGQACDIAIASRHAVPFNVLGMILEIEVEGTSGAGA